MYIGQANISSHPANASAESLAELCPKGEHGGEILWWMSEAKSDYCYALRDANGTAGFSAHLHNCIRVSGSQAAGQL
jgi:hypothetical protein